jgi:hypothetical protein
MPPWAPETSSPSPTASGNHDVHSRSLALGLDRDFCGEQGVDVGGAAA